MSTEMLTLDVLNRYRPGSGDWSWPFELSEIASREGEAWQDYLAAVEEHGITEPIDLGDDGRVWDGHHRLCAAWVLNITSVSVALPESEKP